jgi:hypothetical protein
MEIPMELVRIPKLLKYFSLCLTFGVIAVFNASQASAQTVKAPLICYKGAGIQSLKTGNLKCPSGWTTTKPVTKPSPASSPNTTPKSTNQSKSTAASTQASKKSLSISATYSGKIAMLWGDSGVTATSVTATGTGTTLGLTQLTGSGSSSPSSKCESISGAGVISDGTNTLKANFDPSAQGCAKDDAAPTTININGNVVITGGTGKYAGASGTLKFSGSFPISSTSAGTNESTALTLTISGSFVTK